MSACSSEADIQLKPLATDAVILAFGDSLTFGIGANSQTESYPTILAELTGRQVINSGLPGEISQHGLIRLAEELEETKPDLVILCHGGNDLIRKLSQVELKSNLESMVSLIKQSGAEVVLVAVPNFSLMLKVPPLYSEVAMSLQSPIDNKTLALIESKRQFKSDTVHPNALGYKLLATEIHQLLQASGAL
ncbi:MAG: arylesterase [Gammaproteobacteria bacterium]|nr:MAG: arylesterase [Gammaproteobacteria bacterium]